MPKLTLFLGALTVTGPALVVSVVSLLANVLLIGGSRQLSKDFLLVWIVWKSIAIFIFWLWYGYNQLKYYGYIDWSQYGMKNCMFCDFNPESTYTGMARIFRQKRGILTIFSLQFLAAWQPLFYFYFVWYLWRFSEAN